MSDDEKERSEKNGRETTAKETSVGGNEVIDCGRWTFPFLASCSLFRLLVYIHKLYQDTASVKIYYNQSELFFCAISALCLILPALVYTVYIILLHIRENNGITKQEAGTKIANGLLLIPWQIKSIVEVLHFAVQRICHRRPPTEDEKREHSSVERRAVVLEFFEDFFAGFLQLLVQAYIFLTYYERVGSVKRGLPGTREHETGPRYLLQEFIASGLVLVSMLLAVRQKDDGILSSFFSLTGWALTMASRAFAMALAASVIHSGIVGFCFLHVIGMTLWLTPVCWGTYTDSQRLSRQKKVVTTLLIFFLFALPSLMFWPALFCLKSNKRPAIFTAIITIENAALLCIWYFLKADRGWDGYSTGYVSFVVVGTLLGCLLILIYVWQKPCYTDQIVLHDIRSGDDNMFGMYYDFFNATFDLRVSDFVSQNLDLIRGS